MPIRFACEHCNQRLNVSSSKAGRRARCPKCKEPIRIPDNSPDPVDEPPLPHEEADEPPPASGEPPLASDEPPPASGEPPSAGGFSEFAIYDDDETEWVYDEDDPHEEPRGEAHGYGPIDRDKVAVPRSILYAQGALLGLASIGCFFFGLLVGLSVSPDDSNEQVLPQPCTISGRVTFLQGGQDMPDAGCAVIVVSQDARPAQGTHLAIDNLRPETVPPADDHPIFRELQELNGAYTRADDEGRFEVRVPDRGKYFFLFLSRNARRDDEHQLGMQVSAEMGRYFTSASDLLGSNAFRWENKTIRADEQISISF